MPQRQATLPALFLVLSADGTLAQETSQEVVSNEPRVAPQDKEDSPAIQIAEENEEQIDKDGYTKDPATDPWNEHISMQVSSIGRFNMGANPNPATGGYQSGSFNMMYSWPSSPGTSYSTVRVDGQDYIYGSSGGVIEPPVDDNNTGTNRSSWLLPNGIKVTQILRIVEGQGTGKRDTAEIRYELENTSSTQHNVGLRVMNDVMLANNDGALFRVPGIGHFTTEKEFVGEEVPDYFLSMRSFEDSRNVAAGTLSGGEATPPDRFVIGRWPGLVDSVFDYTTSSGRSITSDSAYAAYWTNRSLPPGERLTFVHYYGASGVTQDLRPPLAVNMFAPTSASIDATGALMPFTMSAFVRNTGNAPAENTYVEFTSLAGFELASPRGVSLGTLAPGQEKPVSWVVRAPASSTEQTYTLGVRVGANGVEAKVVERPIMVPASSFSTETRPYVAIGDSTTTGLGVASCPLEDEKGEYPYGCPVEPANGSAYPDILQRMLGSPYSDNYTTLEPGDYKAVYDPYYDALSDALLTGAEPPTAPALGPPDGHVNRVGVFGYTIKKSVEAYEDPGGANGDRRDSTPWESQLHAVDDAQNLVTVSLGINDMEFSDIPMWLQEAATGGVQGKANEYIDELNEPRNDRPSYMDALFQVLERAQDRDATVVINLYYNPYHEPYFVQLAGQPGGANVSYPKCSVTHNTSETIIGELNEELRSEAEDRGMKVADFKVKFNPEGPEDHGAGGPDPGQSWVYGNECDVDGAISGYLPEDWNPFEQDFLEGGGYQSVAEDFDPHPNPVGSAAMAEKIEEVME